MTINTNNSNAVVVDGQEVEKSFDYLGARITKHGEAEDDIKRALGKA